MKVAVVITGIREIDRKLRRLAPAVQKKVLRKSMRAGMKIMASELKSQAPIDTGLTRTAVKVRVPKRKKRSSIEIDARISSKTPGLVVTPSGGGKPAFYPAIVEYGRRDMPPNPFGRRAFEAKGEAAKQITLQSLRDGVEQEARK